MANAYTQAYQDVGYVARSGEDELPTTGEHLDVRVLQGGEYRDPGTMPSLLTRLKVGKERKPLWEQRGEQWNPAYTITSGYGKRVAPTEDASTYHPGHDYGIPGGTPLAWEGPGTFTPGRGYGSIKTTDAQGTPYEIRLLHTVGGKKSEQPAVQATAPQPTPIQGDTYIILPGRGTSAEQKGGDFLSAYVQQLIAANRPQIRSMVNPAELLMGAFNQTPNYLA